MIWTEEAERAVGKAPFFVRGKIRREVEKEAYAQGSSRVLPGHVEDCRRKFLSGKAVESKGFQVETCFGPSGCENRANNSEALIDELERMLSSRNIAAFLKERVGGDLKIHHEFRICVSDCPNACSRPQIVDIGIIGALRPNVPDGSCTGCGICTSACTESALHAVPGTSVPALEPNRCVLCGKCVRTCPPGAIGEAQRGWRITAGGKLGRHPQLGKELEGIYSKEEVLTIVKRCLDIYFAHNIGGERLGAILNRIGYDQIQRHED